MLENNPPVFSDNSIVMAALHIVYKDYVPTLQRNTAWIFLINISIHHISDRDGRFPV